MSVLYIQGLLLELESIRPAKILTVVEFVSCIALRPRVLGLYFRGQDAFLQIYGTQSAVTKAFPTNH